MGSPLLGYQYRMLCNPTAAEEAIEPAIAALGERYRSQHLFLGMKHIADFALLDRKLIIEVDGDSHSTPRQREKDLKHTLALQALGWTVFRCSNEQAMAAPSGTVQAALTASQTAPAELQADLDQLHRDYPALLVVAAKRPRRAKPRRRAKTEH
jgi:very-short-patch-repair endonuclease